MTSSAMMGWSFTVWGILFLIDSVTAAVVGTSAFNTLMAFDIVRETQVNFLFVSFTFPKPNGEWFGAVGDVLTWNQWLFSGWANYIRFIIYGADTAAFVGPLLVALFTAVLGRFNR